MTTTEAVTRPLDPADMDALAAELGATQAEAAAAWFHPYANAFPLMPLAEQDALGASMEATKQREPCVIYEGKILDGRNRYIQCLKRGLTPRVRPYDPDKDGPDPIRFVEDLNLNRRHLTASQRAMAAAEMETFRQGRPQKDRNSDLFAGEEIAPGQTRAELSERFNVDRSTIADAARVRDQGTPELREAVKSGDIAADAAASLTLAPVERQAEFLSTLTRGEDGRLTPEAAKAVRSLAKELRDQKTAEKKEKRAERERALGGDIAAMPDEQYGFIGEDPEWNFKVWSDETGMDRAADNHYATSADDTLLTERAAVVAKLAAPHCVHGMWTTDLARGIDAQRARGFTPKSYFVWVKTLKDIALDDARHAAVAAALGLSIEAMPRRILLPAAAPGLGYWNRDEDEILLIGTVGNPVCPAMGEQGGSVWYEPKREHSVKPEIFYAWVQKHFAHTPRIELNARKRRPGWQVWGNEVTPAPRAIVDLEREACARGLVDEHGMVRTSPTSVVGFDFVTEAEWRALLEHTDENIDPPIRAADVRALADEPLRAAPHTLVTAAQYPALHQAFEIISHDGGAGCGYADYPVPLSHASAPQLLAIDASLGFLTPETLETFCIGEAGDIEAIATTDQRRAAHRLLNHFFEGFVSDPDIDHPPASEGTEHLDIPEFLRRTA